MKKISRLLALVGATVLAGACGAPDSRSFQVENAIFESLYLDRANPGPARDNPQQAAAVAAGLGAICKGNTAVTRELLRDSAIGEEIYRLALIAAKADAKGACDYAAWRDKQSLLGERFKQLVHSGDAAAVLLASLLDRSLAPADRLAVIKALADKRYAHAEAIYGGMLMGGEAGPADFARARTLLEDAAKQGANSAFLLLARVHGEGLGTPKDAGQACSYAVEAARRGVAAAGPELAKLRAAKACP